MNGLHGDGVHEAEVIGKNVDDVGWLGFLAQARK